MKYDLRWYLSNQLTVWLMYFTFKFNFVHGVHNQRSPICSTHKLPPDSTAPEEETLRLNNRKTCPSTSWKVPWIPFQKEGYNEGTVAI